jgi:dolichol-phosphate mannosyltransferase
MSSSNLKDSGGVSRVIVIPAYNETEALPQLVLELAPNLTDSDLIVIVDDSDPNIAAETERLCKEVSADASFHLVSLHSGVKEGRGGAVRRGFEYAYKNYPNIQWFLECDADGSHRASDIFSIGKSESTADLLVGSRYLPTSRIIGWSFSRRFQSRMLNVLIPLILKIPLNDVTNGLRRYSRRAVDKLLQHPPTSTTFIYLSEQALIVHLSELTIEEVPITFAERRAGTSSVTWVELQKSLKGLFKIVRIRARTSTQQEV